MKTTIMLILARWSRSLLGVAVLSMLTIPSVTLAQATNLTLGFSSPATNASAGATFQGSFGFSPTSSIITEFVTSGTGIVPQTNFTFSVSGTNGTMTLIPLTNTSGTVNARIQSVSGNTTNNLNFSVVFRPYPPTIGAIANRTMLEDGVTNIPFTVSDPDTPLNDLVFTTNFSNSAIIDAAGMSITGSGANRFIQLTPKPDINGTGVVTITVTDGIYTNIRTFNLTVTPVGDPSTITGMVNRSFADNVGLTNVFSGIGINDVDHNMPTTEVLVATATLANDQIALFANGQTTYARTGTPAQVSAQMAGLGLQPLPFQGVPGTINQVGASIRVRGTGDNITITNTITLSIEVMNTPPTFNASLNPTSVVEGATVQPFFIDFIYDPDSGDGSFHYAIEFVNTNQSHLITIGPTNALEDNSAGLQSAIRNINVLASAGIITNTAVNIPLRFLLTDENGGLAIETNVLTLLQAQNPPEITGVPAQTINKTDADPAFTVYPTIFIQDPDQAGLQNVRAVISQSNPALGTFSATNFPFAAPGQLSTSLQAVVYTPTPGALPVGSFAESIVTITAMDSTGLSAQNNSVKIRITSVNNAPQILNIPPLDQQPVLVPPAAELKPFATLGLSNDDTNSILFTLSIDNINKGSLTNRGDFTQTAPGVLQMTGSISNILSSLTNIVYVLNPSYLFPSDDPGGTTFTLSARDYALLTQTRTLYIQVQEAPRNHLVVRAVNDGLPGSFTYALANAGNNDVITFALPSYPAIIRMPGSSPNTLIRNITINGPGANLLTISGDNNGDMIPNRQLFRIRSRVTIKGVTMSHGTAAFGGAMLVESNGILTLRNCAVVNNFASQYGGAIDVDGGQLTLEGCFIARNQLSEDTGMSGAGVSIYTDKEINIINTTFAGNIQPNATGDGGGGLVVQNQTPNTPLNAYITHSTFIENEDASTRASAAFSVDFGTRIRAKHSIFSDFSGRNIDVAGTGEFISHGGNICDDSTKTAFQQQGQGSDVFLLDHATDETLTDPLLAPINDSGDPTPFAAPLAESPAINKGSDSTTLVDQRGVLRQGSPDAGAVEFNALGRLVVNEIHFDDTMVNFIEIYVRRDSTPVDLTPYSLFIDGVKVHDFNDSRIIGTNAMFTANTLVSAVINPGFGMVLAFTNQPIQITSDNNPTPVVRPSVTNAVLDLNPRGTITIGLNNELGTVVRQSYLGVYVSPVTGTNVLDITGNSISLAPQYRGYALIPHSYILPGPFDGADTSLNLALNPSSPGAGSNGTPFGQDNAEPLAVPDIFTVTEDDLSSLLVLANDFDGDGNDRLVIVDVSTASAPGVGDAATGTSQLGADLAVDPDMAPLRGEQIVFDPRLSPILQSLPVGVEIIDTFYYEIIDIGSAPVEGYGSNATSTAVTAQNHRLTNGTLVTISGADPTNYNGTFAVSNLTEDVFVIPVSFAGDASEFGRWETVAPRSPTTRDEASVSVRVVGVNDTPVANLDIITNVTERSTVRLMIRPEQAGTPLDFPGDPVPPPDMLTQDVLSNDDDIDSDDTWESLRVVGVMGSVNEIVGYSGVPGEVPLAVHSPAHGLISGDQVLIANYGGHASYNGYHIATVIDADTFTIPGYFVDDDATKGVWVILNDTNRYDAITDIDATVLLTLRANPEEDHIIYVASSSTFLQGLAEGETYTNRFFYAVEDSHGGIGIGPIDVVVEGVNNTPTANPDPDDVGVLNPIINGTNSLDDVLANGLDLMYILPPVSGDLDRTDLHVLDLSGGIPGTIVLKDFFVTDEDTPLPIDTTDLVANDSDIDRTDMLTVIAVDAISREGASVSLNSGVITYNPTGSSNLQALVREQMVIDSFEVVVSDGFTDGMVTSLVAVLVVGVNDAPVANPVYFTTHEDEVFVFDPRYNDTDADINGFEPDDRIGIVPVTNWPNPGLADVHMNSTSVVHDATVSQLLNQLADWQSFTNVFNYTISDNSFLFAVDDEFYVPAGTTGKMLDVLANDSDYTDSDGVLTIISAGPSLFGGSVAISSNGQSLIYSSPVGFIGDDYFRYTIQNDRGDQNSGRVMVRSVVAAINGVLHAANDHYTVAAGETVVMNVRANDNMLPLNGSGLTIISLVSSSQPGQPILTNNTFIYTATNGLTPLNFRYEVSGGGTSKAQANVQVAVVERRGTLRIQDDTFSVLPGSFENELDVLINDGWVTESTASLRIQEILVPAAHGTLTTNALGTRLLYSPTNGFIGIEHVSYLATDHIGGTGTGVVSIIVGKVEVVPDFYKIAASTNPTPVVLNVLANDRIQPNPRGSLTILSVNPTSSAIGTLQVGGGGTHLLFSPSNTMGQLEFNYIVQDGGIPARSVTGRVTIATVNAGIYANPDRYTVRGGGSDYVLSVLTNDISYPNINKTYTILSIGAGPNAPNHGGTVMIDGKNLIYTPAPGFFGEESFTYVMSDSIITDVAQVTISVRRGDMYANNDDFAVFYELVPGTNVARSFTLAALLNDQILPAFDQIMEISSLGAGTNAPNQGGVVTISPDKQSLIYRPVLVTTTSYIEQFTYEISDGGDRRASGLIRVRVQNRASNLVAVTQNDAFTVARNSSSNTLAVLANDFVLPGNAAGWSVTAVSPSTYGGQLSISNTVVRYTPPVDFVGMDTFTYHVNDGLGGSGSASVSVKVGSMPTLPDLFTVLSDSVTNDLDVLANDILAASYLDEYILHSVFGQDAGGSILVSAHNSVLYTPAGSYTGNYPYVETFYYRVADDTDGLVTGRVSVIVHQAGSDRSTSTIHLLVEGRNDQPWIENPAMSISITDKESTKPFTTVLFVEVDEQTLEKVDVSVSLDDAIKGSLRNLGGFHQVGPGLYALTNVTAANATIAIREIIFDPTENRIIVPTSEMTHFMISITDNKSPVVHDTNSAVNVTAVNDAPLISGTMAGQVMQQGLPIKLFAGVTITEVDDLTQQILTVTVTIQQPSNGTLNVTGPFASLGNGVYQALGITAADASMALRQMEFVVSSNGLDGASSLLTQFTIAANDGFDPPVSDSVTTVIALSGLSQILQPTANDTNLLEGVGWAVAMSSNRVVAGAPYAEANFTNVINFGHVYVYERTGSGTNVWIQSAQISAINALAESYFGSSVGVDQNTIVIGAERDLAPSGNRAGRAYIYDQHPTSQVWQLVASLHSPISNGVGRFGAAVAITSNRVAVGAPEVFQSGVTSGVVFIYHRHQGGTNAWGLERTLISTGIIQNARFGAALAFNGDTLVIGAPNAGTAPTNAGAVFVHQQNAGGSNQWGLVQRLTSTVAVANARLGTSVDFDGPYIVAGAPHEESGRGASYVFKKLADTNVWVASQRLVAPLRFTNDVYGTAVSIHKNLLLVGAPRIRSLITNISTRVGSVVMYSLQEGSTNEWHLASTITPPSNSVYAMFGQALDHRYLSAAIGAPIDKTRNLADVFGDAGTVFMYDFQINHAPVVASPVPDQYTLVNTSFSFIVPTNVFVEPDFNDSFTRDLTFPNGNGGLFFDIASHSITGVPTQPGFILVRLVATDESGMSATNEFNVIVLDQSLLPLSARTLWLIDNFGPSAANAATQQVLWTMDSESDGNKNDQEYAFGGDPNVPDDIGIGFSITIVNGIGTVTFVRRTDDPDLTYRLQATANLRQGPWVHVTTGMIGETTQTLSPELELVRLSVVIDPMNPWLLYRIYVTF